MATRTSTYTGVRESSAATAPTSYKIHSRESLKRSLLWSLTTALVVPIVAVAIGFFSSRSDSVVELYYFYYNKNYKEDINAVVAAGIVFVTTVALLLYYSYYLFSTMKQKQTRDVELSVTICPLGIQRSTTTTTTTTTTSTYNKNKNRQRTSVRHYPLLPIESVKDCILLEHVGGFSVTTHVMIRVKAIIPNNDAAAKTKEISASELVSVFPDAKLTFDQCHDLVQQIQRALEELQQ